MSPRRSNRVRKELRTDAYVDDYVEEKVKKSKKPVKLHTIRDSSSILNNYIKNYNIQNSADDHAKKRKIQNENVDAGNNRPSKITSNHNAVKQENEKEYIYNEKESLLLLNDVCLLRIFSYLNVSDLVHLESLCSRFNKLITSNCYKLYEIVELDNVFSEEEMTVDPRLVLMRIGKYMKDIGNSPMDDDEDNYTIRLMDMIPEYCKNLEVIRFDKLGCFYENTLNKYLPQFNQLKMLYFPRCQISDKMLAKCLQATTSLLKLKLTFCRELQGRGLTKLKNITHLNIYGSFNIKPEYFSKFCKNNKTLQYLNITFCDRLIGSNFHDIAANLSNLEQLAISDTYKSCNRDDLAKLAQLKKLNEIDFEHDSFNGHLKFDFLINKLAIADQLNLIALRGIRIMENTVNSLAKFTKLQQLFIRNNYMTDNDLHIIVSQGTLIRLNLECDKLTNDGIIKCITLCPALQLLHVSQCKQLSEEFILKLPDVLKDRKPCTKLTITVSEYNFENFCENHRLFLIENKDFMEVTLSIW